MIHIWQKLLDSIFPQTIHGKVLQDLTSEKFKLQYHPHLIGENMCLAEYHHKYVQAAIAATKFEHSFTAATLLRALVATWLSTLPPVPTVLVPIPLSRERERERGYNQVTRVLEPITDLDYSIITLPRLLTRTKHTNPQTSLGRTERLKNMNGVFSVNQSALPQLTGYTRVIICDDVITTGATLNAARASLTPYLHPDTKLICVAWAH